MVDKIKGGLADSKTLDDIAEKHGVTLSAIKSALADGIKVESEHTTDSKVAEEIAKDHLFEDAEYYSKLANMEKQNEKNWVTIDGNHVLIEDNKKQDNRTTRKIEGSPKITEKRFKDLFRVSSQTSTTLTAKLSNLEQVTFDTGKYASSQKGTIKFYKQEKTDIGHGKIETEMVEKFRTNNYNELVDYLFDNSEGWRFDKDDEKTNSKDWAKTYKASNFIEKGVCTYNDETIYLSQSTLERAMRSMKGRPVVIKHQKVNPANMQDHAVGYVTDSGQFDSFDAGFTCPFLVFDDEGKEVIAKDYSVSCAYIPKAFGIGGTWHNTPYDREVTELEFTHLALVPDPRYEDAKIYENSKDDDNTTKETYNMEKIEVEQGFLTSLLALVQQPFLNAKDKEEDTKDKEDAKVDDDEMEYEGKKYSKKELVNAFIKGEAKPEVKEEKEMKNEKEAEEEVEKENSKDSDEDMEFFNSMQVLMATAQTDADDKVEVHSQNKGLELGSKAFG
jgi:hypothetical protein